LLRRDLYDARYQLISDASFDEIQEDTEEEDTDDESFGNINEDTDNDTDEDMEGDLDENPIAVTEQPQEPGEDVAIVDAEDDSLVPLPPKESEIPEEVESSPNHKSSKKSRSQPSQKEHRRQQSKLKLGIHDLEYIDAPSDVIPNVYEGGLKTWECSIDLVEHLSASVDYNPRLLREKSILEVGAGTAMPSIFILQSLLNEEPPAPPSPAQAAPDTPPSPTFNPPEALESQIQNRKETVIHLQDYNKSVLELVTVPNLLLAWCKQFFLPPSSEI
jgi:protein-histidine N-methyltransferase